VKHMLLCECCDVAHTVVGAGAAWKAAFEAGSYNLELRTRSGEESKS
jgi:hypothetical protein